MVLEYTRFAQIDLGEFHDVSWSLWEVVFFVCSRYNLKEVPVCEGLYSLAIAVTRSFVQIEWAT